jgi:ABC-type glutathione transport system ATPase component
MQQRASLCRALIHEPELLMLDEPFAALDAFTREELWCVIQDLCMARRFTVILVTHDLREAVFLADRVFVHERAPGPDHRRARDRSSARAISKTPTPEFIDLTHELRDHISDGARRGLRASMSEHGATRDAGPAPALDPRAALDLAPGGDRLLPDLGSGRADAFDVPSSCCPRPRSVSRCDVDLPGS